MARKTSRNTTVEFFAGSSYDSATHKIVVGPGPGSLQFGEMNAENAEHLAVMDRGEFDGFVLGDDLVQECSIEVELRDEKLTDATNKTLNDFLMHSGSFSGAASLDTQAWTWGCRVTMRGSTVATYTLPRCRAGQSFAEAKEGHKISVAFTNHQAPVIA